MPCHPRCARAFPILEPPDARKVAANAAGKMRKLDF